MIFFDANILWGNWQFQGIFMQSPEQFERSLTVRDVDKALIRMSDAAICPDIEKCNFMLFEAFKNNKKFIPVPTINPQVNDWRVQIEQFTSPAINLYPSFHGYTLQNKEVCELAERMCAEDKVILITIRLEDPRSSNQYCRFPEVSIDEIKLFLEKFPMLKVITLNTAFTEIQEIGKYEYKNFYTDIAYAETLETVKRLLDFMPQGQLLYGSNSPLFYTDAAKLKITKASLNEKLKEQIAFYNLSELLNKGLLR